MKYKLSFFKYIFRGMLFHRFIGIIIFCLENNLNFSFVTQYSVQPGQFLTILIISLTERAFSGLFYELR